MEHELVLFDNGSASVRPSGRPEADHEAMHSSIGPWREALDVYVRPTKLAERLATSGPPLVVYDLGMGIAANAIAALECQQARELHLVSFEHDLGGIRLALEHPERFDWVARHRERIEELLDRREVQCAGLRWELREGDFLAMPLRERADVIFFDFYSPRADSTLWGYENFSRLRADCSEEALLATYAASTAARAAMLLAGFHVGRGAGTELKAETTLAAVRKEDLAAPLGEEWLAKLARSSKPLPEDWPRGKDEALARIHAMI